ncbi:MAG TPA: glycosyltransferase [Puia sp.]|nr:glycosyltransferase [Puia sp.]
MIPNIVHFVFGLAPDFGGKPFSLVHYLAIRSAQVVNRPDQIIFHYRYEPEGEWWEKIRPSLTLNRIEIPTEIFGNELIHIAHKSDVVNLRALSECGGIYLDIDTICVRPYHHLLNHQAVMGLEYGRPVFYEKRDEWVYDVKKKLLSPFVKLPAPGIKGLGSSIILSAPGSSFITLWLDSYKTFRSKGLFDAYWNEHSVRKPYQLAQENPQLIKVLGQGSFCLPYYDRKGLKLLFEKVYQFPEAIVYHLWESLSWDRYLAPLTTERIRKIDTTYNLLARKYL